MLAADLSPPLQWRRPVLKTVKLAPGQGHNEGPGRWTKVQREQVNNYVYQGR